MRNVSTDYVPVPIGPVVSDESLGKLTMWCGPAVISSFTGSSYQAVATWLAHGHPVPRSVSRRGYASPKGVRATSTGQVQAALAQCGLSSWRVKKYEPGERPTLAAWLRNRTAHTRSGSFIVQVGYHWVAVKGRKMVDNHTKEPVFIRKAPHRRARVHQVLAVVKGKGCRAKPILK